MIKTAVDYPPVRYALFDFDGTISTLRHGWEKVMEPLMLEIIAGNSDTSGELQAEVRNYIDQSTGIQTIEQMTRLVNTAAAAKLNPDPPSDPWDCKAIYIDRLHEYIRDRRKSLEDKREPAANFLVQGSRSWLDFLQANQVKLYLASGTDENDVRYEAGLLGVDSYFEQIAGARPYVTDCAKEKVIKTLLEEHKVPPSELVIFGDGPVEIRIGVQIGARTVGVASNEQTGHGIDPRKKSRLEKAGAEVIIGDFLPQSSQNLPKWLGLAPERE